MIGTHCEAHIVHVDDWRCDNEANWKVGQPATVTRAILGFKVESVKLCHAHLAPYCEMFYDSTGETQLLVEAY